MSLNVKCNFNVHTSEPDFLIKKIQKKEDLKKIISVLESWKESAEQLMEIAQKTNLIVDEKRFFNSHFIISLTLDYLKKPEPHSVCFIASDKQENMEGLMILKYLTGFSPKVDSPCIELSFLMTHPKNIPSELNQKILLIRGIGSRLLQVAEKECTDNNYSGIFLFPSEEEIDEFYKKKGFVYITSTDGTTKMVKRATAITSIDQAARSGIKRLC